MTWPEHHLRELERLTLPGYDRDVARAILAQAAHRITPLDTIQVVHLLSLGYRRGFADASDRMPKTLWQWIKFRRAA